MNFFKVSFIVLIVISFMSCGGDDPASSSNQVPVLTTTVVSTITQMTAECGGNITSDGGSSVTVRGVCWSTNTAPMITDNKTNDGTGVGSFTSGMSGLTFGTTYYVRAYATNSIGTGYGSTLTFTTSDVPTVTTVSVSAITQTTTLSGGNIITDGGTAVTARGVCWSTNTAPMITDNKTNDGTGVGSFTSGMSGLTFGTTYYVRAYATNSTGTGYGSAETFTTTSFSGTVTDIDGNIYQTVMIGAQEWMVENLKVTHYRNGENIPNAITDIDWLNSTVGAYCEYNNNVDNVATYGRLYNWYAVVNSQNIAPTGWHVPSDAEWKQLEMSLGMSQADADDDGWRGDNNEGGKLKEVGTMHWLSPNASATNESGFLALPGGVRNGYFGGYWQIGEYALFWSTTPYIDGLAWFRELRVGVGVGVGYGSEVNRDYFGRHPDGHSVRCVRD